jgi:hypothetical protein
LSKDTIEKRVLQGVDVCSAQRVEKERGGESKKWKDPTFSGDDVPNYLSQEKF